MCETSRIYWTGTHVVGVETSLKLSTKWKYGENDTTKPIQCHSIWYFSFPHANPQQTFPSNMHFRQYSLSQVNSAILCPASSRFPSSSSPYPFSLSFQTFCSLKPTDCYSFCNSLNMNNNFPFLHSPNCLSFPLPPLFFPSCTHASAVSPPLPFVP